MRKHPLLSLALFSALLVLSGYAVVQAQQTPTSTAAKSGRWSDAATWAEKKVPAANAAVTIGNNMDVVLDVTPPALRSLTISGKLSFADNKDLELTTEWIMLHGQLEIGTEAKPHTRNATITLTKGDVDTGAVVNYDTSGWTTVSGSSTTFTAMNAAADLGYRGRGRMRCDGSTARRAPMVSPSVLRRSIALGSRARQRETRTEC